MKLTEAEVLEKAKRKGLIARTEKEFDLSEKEFRKYIREEFGYEVIKVPKPFPPEEPVSQPHEVLYAEIGALMDKYGLD